jgi:photosystem II stability/assembly factor-like uncharacterized protein
VADWALYLIDKSGFTITHLNDNFGFEFTRIANSVGSFSVDMPPTFDESILTKDCRVEIYRIFEGGAKLVFCGLVNEWELTGTVDQRTTIGGRCINHILKRRIILKDGEKTPYQGGVMLATASIAIAVDDVEIYRSKCPDEATWSEIASLTNANNESEAMVQAENGNVIVGVSLATGTANDSRIYRSTDYGASWASVGVLDSSDTINSVTALGENVFGHALAAWSDQGIGPDDAEIWTSIDDGQNWAQGGSLTGTNIVYCLALAKNSYVVAGTKNGFYVSTDDGATWASTYASGDPWRMVVKPNGDIVASDGGADALYISTDNGLSWGLLGSVGWGDGVWGLALDWDGALVAGVADYATPSAGRIYRSTDGGTTWAQKGSVTGLILIEDVIYAEPVR